MIKISLKDKIQQDMRAAMKEREAGKLKLSVLRMVLSAIKNKEIELKKELDDNAVLEVLTKEVKQRRDAILEYEKAGREDIVHKLKDEIDHLLPYLPQQLSEDEIREIVKNVISQVGATSKRDMGKVMGTVMPQVKGKADGKLVNKIVNEILS